MNMSQLDALALHWFYKFNLHASDLYPGRYTMDKCRELASLALEINQLRVEKNSVVVAHNYLYPEFHELADMVGDSLGLSLHVQKIGAPRVDFESVFFMGATAKIITGDATRVFVPDFPEVIGCSLVFGTDYGYIERWKAEHPTGILVTYINSDAYTKSLSDYISTSRNTDKIIVHAAKEHPGCPILVLPDRFLGYVMKAKAVEQGVNPDLVEIYEYRKGEYGACCHVHAAIPSDSVDMAMWEHPGADLMIHPECGCAASCMLKVQKHEIPDTRAYFLSTEGMVEHAKQSDAKEFLVATEKGMLYRLRTELPGKLFIPVSYDAECRFMKENSLEKLRDSLVGDRVEIVLCDDCCDPKNPFRDERSVHIQRSIAAKALVGIKRMLSIK